MGEFEAGKSYTIVDHATGGIHHYSCLRRTTDEVEMLPVYYEIDGVYKQDVVNFTVKKDHDVEYIVIFSYKGEERRLYANSQF